MKYAGLGGAPVPAAVTERLHASGITAFRSYGSTEQPSITGSMYNAPKHKRLYTDGAPLTGVEVRLTDTGEVENGVAEAAVVAAPDQRLGEHAAAVLRMRPGHHAPDLGQVRRHLEQAGLARQKWPEELHQTSDFPRTPSGKIQKFRLRQDLRKD